MSFLDNLENNLKALESRTEKDPATMKRQREVREAEKAAALRAAPYAEALRSNAFTGRFLTACRTIGHGMRTMVRMTWVESTLRLDAGEKRLELRPTEDGVLAVFFENGNETRNEIVTLDQPEKLAARWLQGTVDAK
jgi:hypothetical protein